MQQTFVCNYFYRLKWLTLPIMVAILSLTLICNIYDRTAPSQFYDFIPQLQYQ